MDKLLSMSESAAIAELLDVLGVACDKDGLYQTLWGKKTLKGLELTVVKIFEAHGINILK